MIQSPIRKALSTIRKHRVRSLLMGGQACILYGAAEFSRDLDLVLMPASGNLDQLRDAMEELQAEVIAVPPFAAGYFERGHAVHFRIQHPEAAGLRVDVMTRMRGVDPFDVLWARRSTFLSADGEELDLLGLRDLVQAKKTQRERDWLMIRRLVDQDYLRKRHTDDENALEFWIRELRTPAFLAEVALAHADVAHRLVPQRPCLTLALTGAPEQELAEALHLEQRQEMQADVAYWAPLRKELEELRHGRDPQA